MIGDIVRLGFFVKTNLRSACPRAAPGEPWSRSLRVQTGRQPTSVVCRRPLRSPARAVGTWDTSGPAESCPRLSLVT